MLSRRKTQYWALFLILLGGSACTARIGENAGITVLVSATPTPMPAPSNLSYATTGAVYVFNDANSSLTANIAPNAPSVTGTVTTWAISPDLNAATGLTFSTTTGIISGKPTLASAATSYTVTASNSGGSTTGTVSIRTGPGFLVNSSADSADSAIGDNDCLTAGGVCTLRAAITQINAMSTTVSRLIVIPAYTIVVGTAMAITNNLEIVGAGQASTILDANNVAHNLMNITGGTSGQTISGLTIQRVSGKAIYKTSAQPLTLRSIKVTNSAEATGVGILQLSAGTTTIADSTFENNVGVTNSSVVGCDGTSTCVVNRTVFSGNADNAMYCAGTSCTITDSTFTGNTGNWNPALYIGCNAVISGTEFSNNVANTADTTIMEGTLFIYGNNINVTVSNSTFYGNSNADNGGAITSATDWTGPGATLTLKNLTVVNNTRSVASGYGNGAGLWTYRFAIVSILNSIFANNTNSATSTTVNCSNPQGGTITSAGYNLEDDTDCPFTQGTDRRSGSPVLGPLQDNGGVNRTAALLGGSQAIQHGPLIATCQATLGVTTDQRGLPRPGDNLKTNCDTGAYETP